VRDLLLSLQGRNAFFDSLCFCLQVFQIFLKPGDFFIFGPESSPEAGMSAATATAAATAAVMVTAVPATAMSLGFTTHNFTSFRIRI
jgi:hypothetical protein